MREGYVTFAIMSQVASAPNDQITWGEQELAALCSQYLASGYQNEALRLTGVRRAETGLTGDFAVTNGAVDSFGVFHLSTISALVMISQLVVVSVHIDQGMKEKRGEVFLHDVSLRCRRQVNNSEISCRLDFVRRRKTGRGTYYKVSCSIDSGAFVGTGSVLHIDPSLSDD